MHPLPAYLPPSAQRANVAGGLAPLIALLAFTLMVSRVIDAQVCFAWFVGCITWVVYELSDYQRAIDTYNLAYVKRHLAWRSAETLRALAADEHVHAPTREFVQRFLDAGREFRRDGPVI